MSDTANTTTDTANNKEKENTSGKPAGGGEPPAGGAPSADEKSFTQADIDAAVKKALKDAEKTAKDKAKEATLSEADQAKARAERAEAELRTMRAKDLVTEAASAAKAKSAAKIYRLYQGEIEFDDAGKPTNIPALIAQAKKDFPDEFEKGGKGSADGGAGGGTGGSAKLSANDIIRRKAGIIT